MTKILTTNEYNQVVKEKYGDWAVINKDGFVATDEEYDKVAWGKTAESAQNKFTHQFDNQTYRLKQRLNNLII